MSASRDRFMPRPLPPPTWLGVMGGGQLGRMFVHAAQRMGYQLAVLEPGADSPAGQRRRPPHRADYPTPPALAELAAQCAAVTTEFENVPADALARLAQRSRVAPAAAASSIAQDRIAEKALLRRCARRPACCRRRTR